MRSPSVVAGALVLILAACGEAPEPRPGEAELGAQIWKSSDTGAVVRPYEDCLRRTARETKPKSDLGLERIDAVLASCASAETALNAKVEEVWKEETREELDERIRGTRLEALRVIRDTPYVPPNAAVPE